MGLYPLTLDADLTLRQVGPEDWPIWRELRLRALAESPHAFSSTLAEWTGENDREIHWRARLNNVPLNLVIHRHGSGIGMVSATAPDATGTVELISLWVEPQARGQGIGDALIESVLAWANHRRAQHVTLSVREANLRAIALYRRHHFREAGKGETDDLRAPECRFTRTL